MSDRSQATRDQLLSAAAQVFAEQGFRAATIRQISELAGANVAAVNYYFGDKETLHREVLERSFALAAMREHREGEQRFEDGKADDVATAWSRLRTFVEGLLRTISSVGSEASWHGKVLLREIMDPSSSLTAPGRLFVETQARTLANIVGDLMGSKSDEDSVRRCSMSVICQILLFQHCHTVAARFFPERQVMQEALSVVADHIARFSAIAIRSFSSEEFFESDLKSDSVLPASETEVHLL